MKDIRIAIDGPASSGKSTVAKIIAKNLGYTYLDTGAMYRSATYLALQNGLTEENVPEILDQLSQHPISFGKAADGTKSPLYKRLERDIERYIARTIWNMKRNGEIRDASMIGIIHKLRTGQQ